MIDYNQGSAKSDEKQLVTELNEGNLDDARRADKKTFACDHALRLEDMKVAGERTAYHFGTTNIDVYIRDPDTARWLMEFVSPWFNGGEPTGTGPCIEIVHSSKRFSDLVHREKKIHLQDLPCFALDSKLVSRPGWTEPDGTTLISDKDCQCYYRLRHNHVEIISLPPDTRPRTALMRILRELMTSGAAAQTVMLDLHAAAFVFNGCAILLAGDKRCGKTTLLTHVLTSPDTALIANDRVMVDNSGFQAHGIPTITKMREGTEKMFPQIADISPRRAYIYHEGELTSARYSEDGAGRPLLLSLAQFARQMNSITKPTAPIGAIIFPHISSSISEFSMDRLSPSEAATNLRRSIYGMRSSEHTATIFQDMTGVPLKRGPMVDQLANAVPAFRCVLGSKAYEENPDILLETLVAKGMIDK